MIYDVVMLIYMCMLCFLLMGMMFKYMLMLLMVMELLILSISLIMFLTLSFMNVEFYMIYYLVFSVCESVMGLMILIMIIRYYGNEYYFSMNLFKFM
uniref:NADH dehydrogenase subunit 4L n=1 Tax=Cryptopone sauteri TaxID=255801 RepID=A0A411HSI0_9HYME|nr:NADH dehydrogenase subunit 4L [Cryptopone sauteri]QBB73602.1 NADH dehydrogenase subunit 4L [Cryptopone sauteri]